MTGFKPMNEQERADLSAALKANAESGGEIPIHMDTRTTGFKPVNRIAHLLADQPPDPPADANVFDRIKSVPSHY